MKDIKQEAAIAAIEFTDALNLTSAVTVANMQSVFKAGYEKAAEKYIPQWVSVEERLPENRKYVLISNGIHIEIALFKHGCWMYDELRHYNNSWKPTHWQSLPSLPSSPLNTTDNG